MADAHKNFAYSLVSTAPSPAASGTSLVVTAGTGTRFPAVPFNATIWPINTVPGPTNSEIVTVTAISTDTLTIVRSAESTSARTVIVGDQIANTVTNKTLVDAEPFAIQYFNNIDPEGITRLNAATSYSKRPIFVPFELRGQSMSQIRTIDLFLERTAGTSINLTGAIAFYSMNNSTQLGLISSESFAISVTTSADWSGLRMYELGMTSISNMDLTQGKYAFGLYLNGSNDSSAVMNLVFWGASASSNMAGLIFKGTNSSAATNQSKQAVPFAGSYSATLATNTPFPATVAKSQISGAGTADAQLLYFQIIA